MLVCDKRLTPTDVNHRFVFPTSGLEVLGIPQGAAEDIEAEDINGTTWSFRLLTRENDKHPKPVLSRGWIPFVHNKGLRVNDRVILLRIEAEGNEVRFIIRAQRYHGRLMGQDLWIDVEHFKE